MTFTNADLFERGKLVMPGGVNSPVRSFRSVGGTPYFVAEADGAYVVDVEGNRRPTGVDRLGTWGGFFTLDVVSLQSGAADDRGGHLAPRAAECIHRALDGCRAVRAPGPSGCFRPGGRR